MSTTLEDLKRAVCDLHALLPANKLVAWTSGNISGRLPGNAAMIIKPSGVLFEDLTPESMCEVDIHTLENRSAYKVSSDTATHAYIYREMPEVGGIVHTHSPYATAWAAVGRDIPCILTAMADEFGGPIVRRFCPDRRRRDRPRGGARADGAPLTRNYPAKSRGLYHRQNTPGRGKGRGDVRGRCPHGILGASTGTTLGDRSRRYR